MLGGPLQKPVSRRVKMGLLIYAATFQLLELIRDADTYLTLIVEEEGHVQR